MATLVLAVGHYDRHMPLIEGSVKAQGVELSVRIVGEAAPATMEWDATNVCWFTGEFDAAEVGLAPYIMFKSKGAAFTGIPIFPRRLFKPLAYLLSSRQRYPLTEKFNRPEDRHSGLPILLPYFLRKI